jgi:LacI family transcriptional regulator
MRGISHYIGPDSKWAFEFSHPSEQALRQLAKSPPDGIIGYLWQEEQIELAHHIGCPVVNHSGAPWDDTLPRVTCDSMLAGRLAADYFLERGFTHFGFLGDDLTLLSSDREKGFSRRIAERGFEVSAVHVSTSPYPTKIERSATADRHLTKWVSGLPPATGVFAMNDNLAWRLAELASLRNMRIPEDIALLGMDNMAMCLLCRPPLSSIRYPSERVGYEAAAMLDGLMNGTAVATQVLVPPDGIVTRHSTDILAVSDPNLAKALRFISARFADDITVRDVALASGLNRRTMEKRFRLVLERSPADEIRRVRVERCKVLLDRPDLSIDDIAEQCGFSGRRWLSDVFARLTGQTPAIYRRARAGSAQTRRPSPVS